MPYDKLQGIVWSCKDTHYGWFDLVETKIEGDEQIFVFKGRNAFSYETDNRFREVIFTDENGNTKTYYAFWDYLTPLNEGGTFMYGDLDIYEETECVTFEYTVKAEQETENAYWYVDDLSAEMKQNRYIGEEKLINGHERTYKFIFAPEDVKNHTFTMCFFYKPSSTHVLEKIEVTFELADKEVTVINEKHS